MVEPRVALITIAVLAACSGEPKGAGTGDTATTTVATTETDTEDTTPTETADTAPTDTGFTTPEITDPQCLQENAVFTGQVEFERRNVTIDPATLAIEVPSLALPKTPLPKGFDLEDAPYYGAVDPNATAPWWDGWTVLDELSIEGSLPGGQFPLAAEIINGTVSGAGQHDCETINPDFEAYGFIRVFNEQFPVCLVQNRITSDVTLRPDHVYFLVGTIVVGTGDGVLGGSPPDTSVTLTVEPGTQVYGASSPGLQSSLVISRGSQIDARGTPELPILFAALAGDDEFLVDPNPSDLSVRGAWGGLILSGNGLTTAAGNGAGEANAVYRPSDTGRIYGGLDNTDSSGFLEYVIIAEGGQEFRNGLFVAGLTLEGVGSGTTIDNVQVLSPNGDCLGVFGGAPKVRHLVCNGAGDDNLDVDNGFQGSIQYALIRQGATNGDNGIEADRDFTDLGGVYANLTILGNAGDEGATRGALHRTGAGGRVFRSVFADDKPARGAFGAGCFDVDDALVPQLEYRDVVFDCSPRSLVECENGEGI